MCPIFNGCEDAAVWSWRVQIRFLCVGMDENKVYIEKVNARDDLVARIINSAVLIKQERQDELSYTHYCEESWEVHWSR
jgi:hypothetical protein